MSRRLVVSLLLFILLTVVGCGSSKHHAHARIPSAGSASVKGSLGHVPSSSHGRGERHRLAASGPVILPKTPSGVSAPSGGWKPPILADGFAAPIGTGAGEDNLWFASNGHGHNSNELETFSPSQVSVTPSGLELNLTYCAGCSESYGSKKNWLGSQIETLFSGSTPPSSHPNLFEWTPRQGDTWAFQFVAKIPPNNEALDPAWWSTDVAWTEELDFTEWWGWVHPEYYAGIPVWVKASPYITHEIYHAKSEIPNPESSLHTYTYEVKPDSSVEVAIDGVHRWTTAATSPVVTKMGLILQDAMRVKEPSSHSTITTTIRSVEVWSSTGQHFVGGGIAPGTSVEGSSEPTPTPTTTTTTTPPPPPPTAPAVPTGCKAEGFLEGTTGKTRASCTTPPSGVSIEWQRTGPWTCAAQATPRYPIWTTGNPITNGLCVEHGKRYDWSARAHSSSGTSAWTTPIPAYTP